MQQFVWVHAERLVHRLDTFTEAARAAKETVRSLIWWGYADLKAYRAAPTPTNEVSRHQVTQPCSR